MNILVPSLGSTSLKYQLIAMPDERVVARGKQERVTDYPAAIRAIDPGGATVDAVAFKTVHGGPGYRGTYRVDSSVIAALDEFLPAAPIHNAIYLTGILAFSGAMPGVPLVAAFETEFHAALPDRAARYGVPVEWRERYGVARYGFHGASHRYVSEYAAQLLGYSGRVVSCHLGGSASICAADRGMSIDIPTGCSPESGFESAARHGGLDAFAVLYMMRRLNRDAAAMSKLLASQAGLAGLSGIAGGDLREIKAGAAGGDANAAMALELFAYQIRKAIGAYAAAMGGIDAIAFTGATGENSAGLRERACAGLEFLGVNPNGARNHGGTGGRIVSAEGSGVRVFTLTTNEEIVVARRAYRCLMES